MANTVRSRQFLHARLIDFIESKSRLFKLDWDETWSEFSQKYPQHSDLTTEQIRHEFFTNVLPNIFKYELTTSQAKRYSLLDNHPRLEKTSYGYQLKDEVEDDIHEKLAEMKNVYFVDYENREKNPNIAVVLTAPNMMQTFQRSTSYPVHFWLSSFVSSNEEIISGTLLRHSTIRERLKRMRDDNQEETGGRRYNFRHTIDRVLKNVTFKRQLQKKLKDCFKAFKARRR